MTDAVSETSSETEEEVAPPVEQPPTRPAWPWFVSIVVALALVVGLVWAAGGFEYREDLATKVPSGQSFTNGPYELSFTSATIQKTTTYSDKQVWSVVVSGTGRTTGDESISPGNDDFAVKDAGSGAVQDEMQGQRSGTEDSAAGVTGLQFTPGLPAIPFRLFYEFPVSDFDQPSPTIIFVAWELEWRDTSLLQIGDYQWAATHDYYRTDLPLQRLPDDLDT